jgi:very-short-patch-repair endonuclease
VRSRRPVRVYGLSTKGLSATTILDLWLKDMGYLDFEKEYRFAPPRRWRFDFAFPAWKLAVEIEGGAFASGRHTRGVGFTNDLVKYNEALSRGWRVLRVSPQMVEDGRAMTWLQAVIAEQPLEGK